MRLRLLHIIALWLVTLCAVAAPSAPFTVVIDAGHGGKDYGCVGSISNEKTIVLDVATRLGDIIRNEHPEVKIIYTRADDRFIPLNERAAIANKASADLFISIHVNSVDLKTRGREQVHGASVYTLGLHRSDDNLAVAMRENSVIELEKDFTETYQGFDPGSSESYIIFELTQNRHQHNSFELADAIQRELTSTASRADKGVLQSGFLVLRATSMPAVLVELDFICNPQAEQFLASADGRSRCARSLGNAFNSYYSHHSAAASPKSYSTQKKTNQNTPAQQTAKGSHVYAIQFLTAESQLQDSDSRLQGIADVGMYRHEGLCKYYSGQHPTLQEARKALAKIKKIHPQAFIIKMRDGQRLAN